MSISHKGAWLARVLYRQCLRLLPRRFYAEYAEQMALDFDDLLQDAAPQGSPFLVAKTMVRAVGDVFLSAVRERCAIGAPPDICDEFAKNDRLLGLDKLALGANKILVLVVSFAALAPGVVAIRRGDALLGLHVASITSAYVVAILSALVGIYAMVRSVYVRDITSGFRDQLVQQSRWVLGLTASMTAVGFLLGACWWHAKTGRFVDGRPTEIGAMAVFGFATAFYLVVKHRRISAVRLGQFTLAMSLVTLVSWFGPNMLR
jgi:hypothetical protein